MDKVVRRKFGYGSEAPISLPADRQASTESQKISKFEFRMTQTDLFRNSVIW